MGDKCLYDSEEANQVMAKYARKQRVTPYLIKQTPPLNSPSSAAEEKCEPKQAVGKIVLGRSACREDEFFVATDTKNPLRIKISIIPEEQEVEETAQSCDDTGEKSGVGAKGSVEG